MPIMPLTVLQKTIRAYNASQQYKCYRAACVLFQSVIRMWRHKRVFRIRLAEAREQALIKNQVSGTQCCWFAPFLPELRMYRHYTAHKNLPCFLCFGLMQLANALSTIEALEQQAVSSAARLAQLEDALMQVVV
jgi:hypothetical protein